MVVRCTVCYGGALCVMAVYCIVWQCTVCRAVYCVLWRCTVCYDSVLYVRVVYCVLWRCTIQCMLLWCTVW